VSRFSTRSPPAMPSSRERGRKVGVMAMPPLTNGSVETASWSPDGDHFVLALNLEGTPNDTQSATVVYDRDGMEVSRLVSPPNVFLRSAVFTSDGGSIVTSRVSGRNDPNEAGLAIWDWQEGGAQPREVRTRPLDLGVDPQGARIAAVNQIEGSAEVWDLEGEEAGKAAAWAVRVLTDELRRNPASMKEIDHDDTRR